MRGQLYINGSDAYDTWGVCLEQGAYGTLLGGEKMKPYTQNESRRLDGVEVDIRRPRVEARSLVLTFCFVGENVLSDFDRFFATLRGGRVVGDAIFPLRVRVPELGRSYELIYEARTSVMQLGMGIAKVGVKFKEPKPVYGA